MKGAQDLNSLLMSLKRYFSLKNLSFLANRLISKFPNLARLFVIDPIKSRIIVAKFIKSYDQTQNIKLCYDTSISPPTYGDFFNLVMLGRFLVLSGKTVKIQILDTGPRKGVYNIELEAHRRILREYKGIARKLLPKNTEIEIVKKFVLLNNEATFNSKVVFSHSPRIIQILTKHYAWKMPSNFLLLKKLKSINQPYIAWGIRHSQWSEKRNAEIKEVLNDHKVLRDFFPKHSIMVLTTKEGWNKYKKVLEQADRISLKNSDKVKIYCQPVFGFSKTIEYLLNANFYFQRYGSGLGTVAHYSNVPYLLLAKEFNYEFNLFQKSRLGINYKNQKFRMYKYKHFSLYFELNKLFKAKEFRTTNID